MLATHAWLAWHRKAKHLKWKMKLTHPKVWLKSMTYVLWRVELWFVHSLETVLFFLLFVNSEMLFLGWQKAGGQIKLKNGFTRFTLQSGRTALWHWPCAGDDEVVLLASAVHQDPLASCCGELLLLLLAQTATVGHQSQSTVFCKGSYRDCYHNYHGCD